MYLSGPEPTSPTLGYAAVLNIIIIIGIVYAVADGRCVRFARLVYTVFYVCTDELCFVQLTG